MGMNILIKCDCGNKIEMDVCPKKYLQLRDNLERGNFCFDGAEIKDNKLKEFRIRCCKCNNWITLGVE